ncbi:GyrI-like domain-containing protein [Undibacterium sp.]|uniref:AraC family transcriptional regulator n=1 Tax=Undibacterium sp. TaxID=1914977 RepID=UPI0025EC4432|nr:AraC family transcriptional regulator [Undibacterium sp.]
MSTQSFNHYERRLSRVTAYLHAHLDQDLDLNKLAEVACMSPYHWHRIYQAVHGESVVAAVKRLRLQRAANHLARSEMTIDQIANLTGYPNRQSFTRTFSAVYGLPPARYRKAGSHIQFSPPSPTRSAHMYPVNISSSPTIPVICVEHIGAYIGIAQAFDTLKGCASSRDLFDANTRWFGVYLDDPVSVAESELRSLACISPPAKLAPESLQAPLRSAEIKGGKYAVLHYKGPYSDMAAVYQWLYGNWLPASGQEAADAPAFEEYLNNPRDTAPTELLTNIYLPLR